MTHVMSRAKHLVTIMLAAIIAMAMSGIAKAGTIEVQEVLDGETYTAYKILNYTSSGDAYSYYLTDSEYGSIGSVLEGAGFVFAESADGSRWTVTNADALNTSGVSDAAAYLAEYLTAGIGSPYTATGADGSAAFTNLPAGYYFVTTSAGSLCALHSDVDIATAVEKNTVPTITKATDSGSEYVQIGQKANFTITYTDGTGTDKAATITDAMDDGLTLDTTSIVVKKGSDVVDSTNYTLTTSTNGFTLVLTAAYVDTLEAGDVITVTYAATLADSAAAGTTENNKVTLTYSQQTEEKTSKVDTNKFEVLKYADGDNTKNLAGAVFQLQDAAGNVIRLTKVNDTNYKVDPDGTARTFTTVASGNIVIDGVDSQLGYKLLETAPPEGYNPLTRAVSVTVGADNATVVEVENNAGAELPSTGGMGTTLIYAVGAILVLGSAVGFVARRKMNA